MRVSGASPLDPGPGVPWEALLLGAAAGAALTAALAGLARRRGWTDAARGPAAARKRQALPVPPVGGPALVGALLLLEGLGLAPLGGTGWGAHLGVLGLSGSALLPSLVALVLVGLVDDLRPGGLAPAAKLGAQAVGLVPLALAVGAAGAAPSVVLAAALAGLVAANVLNTFDNADGAAAGTGLLGLAGTVGGGAGTWGALGALAGFLPLNLDGARRGRRTGAVAEGDAHVAPSAYLGDGGAYALALLLVLHPVAWAALWVPLLDLARVSFERLRRGAPPWVGDRGHLAHRLQRRGLGRPAVAGLLVGVGGPALAGAWCAANGRGGAWAGLALATLAYAVACRASRPAEPHGEAVAGLSAAEER